MLLWVVIFLRSVHKLEDIRNISFTFCGSFSSPLNIEMEIKLDYYTDAIQDNEHFQIWAAKSALVVHHHQIRYTWCLI